MYSQRQKRYASFSVWRKKPIRAGAISELGRIGRNGVGLESIAFINVAVPETKPTLTVLHEEGVSETSMIKRSGHLLPVLMME